MRTPAIPFSIALVTDEWVRTVCVLVLREKKELSSMHFTASCVKQNVAVVIDNHRTVEGTDRRERNPE